MGDLVLYRLTMPGGGVHITSRYPFSGNPILVWTSHTIHLRNPPYNIHLSNASDVRGGNEMAIEFGSPEAQRIIRRDRAIARYITKHGADPRDEKERLENELAGWSAMFAREQHGMEEYGRGDEWNEDMVWINEERKACMGALDALRERMALYGGGSDE